LSPLEDHSDIEKFKLSFTLFKDCMLIAFPLTLTNECKHVMNPYCVNKSKFFFANASNSLGKASQCAQLKTNYLSVRFKVNRITQSYNG
jgi:hypothetical protein